MSFAAAQDRVTLGWGRLLTNDLLGDGRDRWRTGSYTLSRVRGPAWGGSLSSAEIENLLTYLETIQRKR